MLLAQFTDIHIIEPEGKLLFDRVDTCARFNSALSAMLRLPSRPDLILLTGDLVDNGTPAEYRKLRRLIQDLPMPVFLMAGNHDNLAAMRDEFRDHLYLGTAGPMQYTIDDLPMRIVAVDTVIPGKDIGELDEGRLQWLDRTLAAVADKPTLIAMHHPPIASGHLGLDQLGLQAPEQFFELLARHRQVIGVISGHFHRAISSVRDACPVHVCPATAQQLWVDFRSTPSASFVLDPPGFQLHRWDNNALTTFTMLAGDFPGPFDYF